MKKKSTPIFVKLRISTNKAVIQKTTWALFFALFLVACGPSKQKTENIIAPTVPDLVNVYYFHGKQQCKTCIAVGDIAKKTIEKNYSGNKNVRFVEINTSENPNEPLIEKYEVTWNALIIAKGDNMIDITEQAFASALENPQTLENLIKAEVNNHLQ